MKVAGKTDCIGEMGNLIYASLATVFCVNQMPGLAYPGLEPFQRNNLFFALDNV
jgi:hypothetical protein